MNDVPAVPPTPRDARPAADVAEMERLLSVLRAGGDARPAKVSRVRRSVRAAEYENDLKLTVAVDRVAAELERG